jgi:multiple sugar transport system substrate-binding protein
MLSRLSNLICFLLMAITIVGCRSNQSEHVTDPANTATTTAPITLTLSGWQSNPNEKKALDQALKNFEAANPTIKVKYEVINSQYMDVIKTRLIGEVAPDVFYLDAFEAPLLMKYGVLEPLDAYIAADYQLTDFEPALLQAFTAQDQLYGIPKDFSTLALLYNQKAFAAAGLTRPPETWTELQAYAKKLTIDRNQDGRTDQYGFGIAPEMARQVFMIKAFGGQIVNQYGYAAFASPQGLRGLELVINQYRRDRTAAQPTDVGASSGSEMFGQGRAAMVIEGLWAIPYLQETFPDLQFATAKVPPINDKQGTMAYTVAYVMNRRAKHKAAAWKLIAFLTSAQGMRAASAQGLALPTRRSVLQELGYKNKPLYAPFVVGAGYATVWQAGENLPIILTNFDNQFISALLGEQPLETAMKKAQETANREIYLSN